MPKKIKNGKLVLTHGQLKKQIVDYLRAYKWLVIPIQQGAFSYRGIADLYILKNGFSTWIEIKVGRDKQSIYQNHFDCHIRMNGGRYWLIRNLEELENNLRDYKLNV